ncbi:MAG TPA: magnesium transporter, partial [Bacteroidetes bacterium]|nr:magnesium transporter [Bacteroidota bacterium]
MERIMSVAEQERDPYPTIEWLESTIEDLRELIANRADGFIRNIVRELRPADIAHVLRHLSREERLYLFSLLDPETASDVLAELDEPIQEELIREMDSERLSQVIDEMESDDATDVVAKLPSDVAEEILESIDREDSAEVRELLSHAEDTAGGIMAKEFVAVNKDLTVDQAIQKIRHMAKEIEDIYNVFAVDDEGHLVGVVPLQDLLLARPGMKVQHIMDTDVVYVTPDVDQEEVARLFKMYDLVSIPVVDEDKRLIGRITIDDVMDVIEEEASEDAQMIAGITTGLDFSETSPLKVSRARLPWLIVSFTGEIISGQLMSMFHTTLTRVLYIVFFVPLIMAIGGNVGNQSAIMVIRGLDTGEVDVLEMGKRLRSELLVSLILASVLATAIFMISWLWFH